MIRAVLFDLDDTLVDHQHASRAAIEGVRARFEAFAVVGLDALVAENQRILDQLHHEVAIGVRDVADARIERYRRLFAYVGDTGERAGAAAELARRLYQANRRPVAGALELVTLLAAHVRIAVVTNNTVAEQREKLATFGFAPMVSALVTSEEMGAAKPDRRIFRAALDRMGCGPHEAVMIGDAWVQDVLGATGAGIRALWLNRDARAHPAPSLACELRALHPAAEIAALAIPELAPFEPRVPVEQLPPV